MERELKGENGSLLIGTGEGSRAFEYYLSTGKDGDFFGNAMVDIRPSGTMGGGMHEKTYQALGRLFGKRDTSTGMRHGRKPAQGRVVLMGDDFGISDEFSTIELVRDAQGMTVETKHIGVMVTSSGPIRFSEEPALDRLFDAVARDSKAMARRITHEFSGKTGNLYGRLSLERLGAAERHFNAASRFRIENHGGISPQEAVDLYDTYYEPIKQAGLFVLKTGAQLPEESRALWLQTFGQQEDVQAVLAEQHQLRDLGAKR